MRLHEFPDTISWSQAAEGQDAYGRRTHADAVDVPGRLEERRVRSRSSGAGGDVLVPETRAHLCADIGARTVDRFVVAGVQLQCTGVITREGYQVVLLAGASP